MLNPTASLLQLWLRCVREENKSVKWQCHVDNSVHRMRTSSSRKFHDSFPMENESNAIVFNSEYLLSHQSGAPNIQRAPCHRERGSASFHFLIVSVFPEASAWSLPASDELESCGAD